MPYFLESDSFADDPAWPAMAGGSAAREDALRSAYTRLQARAALNKSDGFVTEVQVLELCRGRRQLAERLATRVLADREPMLHRPGDQCECLPEQWRDGYQYAIHGFLKRNPARRETDRNRAQAADLRDARLKHEVYLRDAGCCRYCRSGPLPRKGMGRARDRRKVIQFDHVDPDRPAGADAANLVVSCARCNEFKGRRTPAEADMLLLPVPTDQQRAEWATRPLTLLDCPPDNAPTTDEQPTQQPTDALSDGLSDALSTTDRSAVQQPGQQDVSAGELCPDNGPSSAETGPTTPRSTAAEGLGSGRVGQPVRASVDQLGQPSRSPAAPDVYHRRSRARPPPHLRDPPPLDDHLPDLPPEGDP